MSGPTRNLTLTEELEKLEQSITLTLQEIDSNFSRAHRIVTTSILPIVEQYAEHSKDVWEGAKFWKQFFEASANVSLSGYEENPNHEDTTEHEETTVTEDSTNVTNTNNLEETEAASFQTPSEHLDLGHGHHESELDLSSLTISPSHSTPRPGKTAHTVAGDAETPSSMTGYTPPAVYREEEYHGNNGGQDEGSLLPTNENEPVTPGRSTVRYHYQSASTPMSSPFIPPPTATSSHIITNQLPASSRTTKNFQNPTDPVLHHVLDKTYRVQATPLSKGYYKPTKFSVATPKAAAITGYKNDYSPLSSPELEAPKLHAEIFASPMLHKKTRVATTTTPGSSRARRDRNNPLAQNSRITPKPGISVLTTPSNKSRSSHKKNTWDSDDDDEEYHQNKFFDGDNNDDDDGYDTSTAASLGISPPKTMQFHIPQSRLMKTPAKEASKRIVSDLLASAGGTGTTSNFDNDDDDEVELAGGYNYGKHGAVEEDHSPTVVRSGGRLLEDDTF